MLIADLVFQLLLFLVILISIKGRPHALLLMLAQIQGVPKYSTHLFMTLHFLVVMDWETETAFILTPICVALK